MGQSILVQVSSLLRFRDLHGRSVNLVITNLSWFMLSKQIETVSTRSLKVWILILTQALHQPITSLLSFALIGIFAAIHQRHAGYSDVGMSYDRVLDHTEFWRCGTSQLAHVELLHLVFNLSALWSVGIAEQILGQLYYLKITALLFLLSPIVSYISLCLYICLLTVSGLFISTLSKQLSPLIQCRFVYFYIMAPSSSLARNSIEQQQL